MPLHEQESRSPNDLTNLNRHTPDAQTKAITIPMPDDFHVHLRQGSLLSVALRAHAGQVGRILVMPNTTPPIITPENLARYHDEIHHAQAELPPEARPEALFTFKILPGMKPEQVLSLARAGVVAGKYYPAGVTTNAQDGPRSFDQIEEVLSAMEEVGLILSIHGEDPDAPVFERERAFLPQVETLLIRHPKLRIVLEHLSDAESVRFVLSGPERLAGTITAHHLLYTREDMMGSAFNPHLYCKPVLKTERDRTALREAVFSGSPKFFFGSDSAPHPREKKECTAAASGVFSALTAIPAIIELFESLGGETCLSEGSAPIRFLSRNGAAFYGLPPSYRTLTLLRKPWSVPENFGNLVPMCASQTLSWQPDTSRWYSAPV